MNYFFSYSYTIEGVGSGFGNGHARGVKVLDWETVQSWSRQMKEQNPRMSTVVILNVVKLDD